MSWRARRVKDEEKEGDVVCPWLEEGEKKRDEEEVNSKLEEEEVTLIMVHLTFHISLNLMVLEMAPII